MQRPSAIQVAGETVAAGSRRRLELPVSRLPTGTPLSIPLEVVHGRRRGPALWISGAVHGDELNGVEIVRRVLARLDPDQLSGTVIAAPIVNVFGFIDQSRYLPDRRDLNRSFPGSKSGSLAARLAHQFMTEVVKRCQYGIDLHTGSNHRTNLPQLRVNLRDRESLRCAKAFAAPVIIDSQTRDGSLRHVATKLGIHVLVYEAGESLRFDADAIQLGVDGVLRVLALLKMRSKRPKKPTRATMVIDKSRWIRARRGGILRLEVELGAKVVTNQRLGTIADAFGDNQVSIATPRDGTVIGHTNNPLVHQGDAVIHVALERRAWKAGESSTA